MKVTILGSGTSTGVPEIGCTCPVCTSTDPRDRRLRCSALIEAGSGTRILVDCGPDFRRQMLSVPFAPLDAVLLTHEHYDHVGGIDDLRPFCRHGSVDLYAQGDVAEAIRRRIPYCFAAHKYPGVPALELHEIEAGCAFPVKDTEVLPFRVWHGRLPILGYRIGGLAYITDMTALPDESLAALDGITHLVMNALRIAPHPTHQSLQEALDKVELLRSRTSLRTVYLIHMSHSIGLHREVDAALPPYVRLAYDGLSFSF